MSEGRTIWRAKPCGWRGRERVVALGEEFGPAGPLVLDVCEELAKEQRGENGEVRAGLRSIARDAFLERGTAGQQLARDILAFGARVGAFDDLEIADDVDMTVTLRVSGFAKDTLGRGYEAVRKSQKRAEQAAGQDPVHRDNRGARPGGPDSDAPCPGSGDKGSVRPEQGDAVPICPPTGQERTGEKEEEERASAQTIPHQALPDVLAVLDAIPAELMVDPLPVEHVLAAYPKLPDRDLIAAAHDVAAWLTGTNPPDSRDASTLLRSTLRRNAQLAAIQESAVKATGRRPAPKQSREDLQARLDAEAADARAKETSTR